jgi:hypothetical protein
MPLVDINWRPSNKEVQQFAGLLALFAGVVGGLLVYRSDAWPAATIVWIAGGTVGVIGLVAPKLVRPLMIGWTALAYPIGWTVSWVVLLVTYYGILMPVALIMRMFRYDPLDRRLDPKAPTYWVEHEQPADPAAYFRQF